MIVALLVLATAGGAQVAGDVVSVTEFAELVADPGGEAEDAPAAVLRPPCRGRVTQKRAGRGCDVRALECRRRRR